MAEKNDIRNIELKDTLAQLNSTIQTQNDLILSLKQDIKEWKDASAEKDKIIANLQAELSYLKTKVFGSTSEPTSKEIQGQMNIFDLNTESEDDEKPAEQIEPEVVAVQSYKREKKHKATYDEVFADLPTTEVQVDTLTEEQKTCAACGSKMIAIGHEVLRTELRYTEPKLERIVYVGTTWACPNCKDTEDNEFVKDKGTPALIEGSYVSSGLAAHVMYAKYVLGLPLYRQEQDFKRLGAPISRTTMAHWIIACSQNYLEPVYQYLRKKLLERKYLMADETPIQVLKEPDRRPQSKSYVWVIRTGEDEGVPIILFNYTPTRARYNIAAFLKGKTDSFYLMVDGYQGYNNLPNAIRCCCLMHIRRYFYQAIPNGHGNDLQEPAVQGVMYCDKLFRFEKTYREKGLSPKQIQNRRIKDQKPVIEAFLQWADQQHPKSGDRLIRALTYLQNCRPYIMNYLEDGNCSICNGLSENSIRPLVVGRKNWLFSDTQDGADASMRVFSIVETAKANELDPQKYLEYLLEQRPTKDMTDEQLEQLMPWNSVVAEKCKK